MTERRTTITLGWRPPGAPARRVDDFMEEQAATTPAPVRSPPARQIERRSIGRRLENWGMWANMDNRGGGSALDNMTAVIYENARRAGLVDPVQLSHAYAQNIDARDAEKVNAALPKLSEAQCKILQWTYVVCLKPWGVAGACGFPTREYDARLLDAQEAIEAIVGCQPSC